MFENNPEKQPKKTDKDKEQVAPEPRMVSKKEMEEAGVLAPAEESDPSTKGAAAA